MISAFLATARLRRRRPLLGHALLPVTHPSEGRQVQPLHLPDDSRTALLRVGLRRLAIPNRPATEARAREAEFLEVPPLDPAPLPPRGARGQGAPPESAPRALQLARGQEAALPLQELLLGPLSLQRGRRGPGPRLRRLLGCRLERRRLWPLLLLWPLPPQLLRRCRRRMPLRAAGHAGDRLSGQGGGCALLTPVWVDLQTTTELNLRLWRGGVRGGGGRRALISCARTALRTATSLNLRLGHSRVCKLPCLKLRLRRNRSRGCRRRRMPITCAPTALLEDASLDRPLRRSSLCASHRRALRARFARPCGDLSTLHLLEAPPQDFHLGRRSRGRTLGSCGLAPQLVRLAAKLHGFPLPCCLAPPSLLEITVKPSELSLGG
mmetsp:Transcript_98186/g.302724  ORF Transcript_98186/g.302724 Transcript_98186/m.302724 type:complete len:380 (-) Transcript_98186:234-1373(-)